DGPGARNHAGASPGRLRLRFHGVVCRGYRRLWRPAHCGRFDARLRTDARSDPLAICFTPRAARLARKSCDRLLIRRAKTCRWTKLHMRSTIRADVGWSSATGPHHFDEDAEISIRKACRTAYTSIVSAFFRNAEGTKVSLAVS